MNNSIKNRKFKPKKELFYDLTKLLEQNPEKFFFLEAFMKAIVNKEKISVSMSLNEDTHTVSVIMGEYSYKEAFKTLEDASNFIDNVKYFRKEIA